jgi:acyl-CoA reductase-like NAD-dependent aldehyde dehydrogenase
MSIAGFEGLKLPDLSIRAGQDTLSSRSTLLDEDPCSGEVFAEIPIASPADVDAVVERSWKAFREPAWRDVAPLQRERLLHRFADAGVKRSGIGRENGPDVFGAYLEPKTVVMAP